MKVSILYMTIDRYPSCIENLNSNLARGGIDDYELLWCDNGSKDERVKSEMLKIESLAYARVNKENCGIARSMNQLMLRARGDFIVQLGNDYEMPDRWLEMMVNYATSVNNSGMVGIAWSKEHLGNLTKINLPVHLADYSKPIFGVKLKTREMLNKVGAFDEMLHPYGLEDSDYHQRSCLAGFNNYYIPGVMSKHLGGDVGEKSDYRKMKDFSLRANGPYFVKKDYARFGYYVPWPAPTSAF